MFAEMPPGPIRGAITVDDVRTAARHRLPRVLFDFIDGGSEGEVTLAANLNQFNTLALQARQASPVRPSAAIRLLGEELTMPVLIAPCGSARLVHPDGELALARAAAAAGIGYVVPHVGGHSLERARSVAPDAPGWYQLYKVGGRAVTEAAIDRAAAAGYRTLVVTIDNGGALRPRDVRNGLSSILSGQVGAILPRLGGLLVRPGWLWRYLRTSERGLFPNIVVDGRPMKPPDVMVANRDITSRISWADVAWIRAQWRGTLVIKSIVSADDACRAIDAGADGIVVSNHGGRGLDFALPTLRALPLVLAAVPAGVPVLFDGGVRRGSDIIKALALGASAVLVGRTAMFALAFGEAGVAQVLAMLREDLLRTLQVMGVGAIDQLDPSCLAQMAMCGGAMNAHRLSDR